MQHFQADICFQAAPAPRWTWRSWSFSKWVESWLVTGWFGLLDAQDSQFKYQQAKKVKVTVTTCLNGCCCLTGWPVNCSTGWCYAHSLSLFVKSLTKIESPKFLGRIVHCYCERCCLCGCIAVEMLWLVLEVGSLNMQETDSAASCFWRPGGWLFFLRLPDESQKGEPPTSTECQRQWM